MDHWLHAASLLTSSLTAIGITQYDPSSHSDTSSEASSFGHPHDISPLHSSDFQHHDDNIVSSSSALLTNNAIFSTPISPTLFITAISIYVLSTLYTQHLHRRHRFQTHFLILGLCAGVLIASVDTVTSATRNIILGETSSTTQSLPSIAASLRMYVPWTVLTASASSAVVHFAVGGMIADEEEEQEEEKAEKLEEKIDRESGDVVGGAVRKI